MKRLVGANTLPVDFYLKVYALDTPNIRCYIKTCGWRQKLRTSGRVSRLFLQSRSCLLLVGRKSEVLVPCGHARGGGGPHHGEPDAAGGDRLGGGGPPEAGLRRRGEGRPCRASLRVLVPHVEPSAAPSGLVLQSGSHHQEHR